MIKKNLKITLSFMYGKINWRIKATLETIFMLIAIPIMATWFFLLELIVETPSEIKREITEIFLRHKKEVCPFEVVKEIEENLGTGIYEETKNLTMIAGEIATDHYICNFNNQYFYAYFKKENDAIQFKLTI